MRDCKNEEAFWDGRICVGVDFIGEKREWYQLGDRSGQRDGKSFSPTSKKKELACFALCDFVLPFSRCSVCCGAISLLKAACPNCSKSCGAAYGYEFTCFYCNYSFPGPKPLLRFQADLSDGTGSLPVCVEHREAEMLLGMTGEELIEANQEGRQFSPTDINDKFTDFQFLF
ncbi:uncharacterized protein [Primulina huaijiensis]|uniref:uncharacterized protein n=1 Tax=Primulina huaijiensis TaxID=1492673 RepID=UPI003CC70EA6